MSDHLIRVQRKIEQVKCLWFKSAFGADGHNWKTLPSKTEEELLSFERKHYIRLPDGYREFLKTIGNGGMGPFYGILPLNDWDEVAQFDDIPDDYLSRPCPMLDIELDKDDWPAQLGCNNYFTDDEIDWDPYQGSMAISFQGCTFYTSMIISGPLSGRICNVNENMTRPSFSPYPTFLDWYEGWLDSLLNRSLRERIFSGLSPDWYGY